MLQQRYSQHEKKYAEANMRLTEEYKRITEHFKDLQAKFSHFQQADLNKYQAVRPPNPHDLPATCISVTCMCLASDLLLVYTVPISCCARTGKCTVKEVDSILTPCPKLASPPPHPSLICLTQSPPLSQQTKYVAVIGADLADEAGGGACCSTQAAGC